MSDAAPRRAATSYAIDTPATAGFLGLENLRAASDRRLVQLVLVTMLFTAVYFAAADLLNVRPGAASFESRLLARALSLAVPIAGLWLVRRARSREALSRTVLSLVLVTIPVLMVLLWQRPRGSQLAWGPMLLILIVMYGALPNTMMRQMLPPLTLSVYLAVARVTWLTGGDTTVSTDLVVLILVNIIGMVMVRRRVVLQKQVAQSWRQEDEARAREHEAELRADRATRDLGALRGIIPICSNCKQVRIAAGEWQQIERYVRDHSDADFSHGICPGCATALYGEYLPDG